MKVLILGFSKIVQSRVLPAISKIATIINIDIASYTSDEETVKQFISGNFYNDYQVALKQSGADIVYVSTVNSDHLKWVKNALNNNFHVIVDKPAFLTKANAIEMLNLAKHKNKCLAEAMVYQYHPQLEAIRNLFKEHCTEPKNVSAFFSFPGFADGNFRKDLKLGGGAIYDLGPYAVSIARFIFEKNPEHIMMLSDKKECNAKNEIDESFTLMMQFPNSKTYIGYFGFGTEYINSAIVLGKGLNIKTERIFTTVPDMAVKLSIRKDNKESELNIEPTDSFQLFVENVLDAVANNNFEYHYNEIEINAILLDRLLN